MDGSEGHGSSPLQFPFLNRDSPDSLEGRGNRTIVTPSRRTDFCGHSSHMRTMTKNVGVGESAYRTYDVPEANLNRHFPDSLQVHGDHIQIAPPL